MNAYEQLVGAKTPYNHRMNTDVSSAALQSRRLCGALLAVQRNSIEYTKSLLIRVKRKQHGLKPILLLIRVKRKQHGLKPILQAATRRRSGDG